MGLAGGLEKSPFRKSEHRSQEAAEIKGPNLGSDPKTAQFRVRRVDFKNPIPWKRTVSRFDIAAHAAQKKAAKGGPLPAFFSHGFPRVVPKPLQIQGYCTSATSEMSCVMQIRGYFTSVASEMRREFQICIFGSRSHLETTQMAKVVYPPPPEGLKPRAVVS